jgi:hypothetical protein
VVTRTCLCIGRIDIHSQIVGRSTTMSHSNTSTALRWRARMTREAIDSTLSLDETDIMSLNNPAETGMSNHRQRWYHRYCSCCCHLSVLPERRHQFFLRLALVATAGSLSLYSLLEASRSWQNAVTVTLQLAVLVILVLQGMNDDARVPLTEYRKQQAATRRQYQAMQEKNENLLHKIRLHQSAMDRVGTVLQELALHTNETTSVDSMVRATKEQGSIRRDLTEACRRQLLQDVVSILLAQEAMDWDKNPFVQSSTIERIVWACKNAKAMEFDEKRFREYLVDDTSNVHVIKLLKVVSDQRWKWSPEHLLGHGGSESIRPVMDKDADTDCDNK